MLELVRRDDESNPAKGQTAARELIDKEGAAILYGGIDSPVSLAIVPLANTAKVPFMGVWAAATNITRNGANPNFVFRVSAVDVLVDRIVAGRIESGTIAIGDEIAVAPSGRRARVRSIEAWPAGDTRLAGTHWAFDPGARDLSIALETRC